MRVSSAVPSAVVHGVVPLLFLLALRRDARKVWVLWPLTFAPDLDYLFELHRAALTNVFVLLPIIIAMVWTWREGKRNAFEWWLVAFVYITSHMLMDMFTGGIVPLWPLSDYTVCYYANVLVHTTDNSYSLDYGACSHEGIPQVIEYYPWLSDPDAAMLAFLLPAALVVATYWYWRGRRAKANEAGVARMDK